MPTSFLSAASIRPLRLEPSGDKFAFRHELAHIISGNDVGTAVFLSHQGFHLHSERVADLFAHADLVPGWSQRMMRKVRMPWREVARLIRELTLCNYSETWSANRVEDRARLRLRLLRECGI